MPKVILYISCTLDDYLAGLDNDLSFLEKVHIEGEDYGYTTFVDSVDSVIVGRKTYQWVIDQGFEYPHADKETYIITLPAREDEAEIFLYGRFKAVSDFRKLTPKMKEFGNFSLFFC